MASLKQIIVSSIGAVILSVICYDASALTVTQEAVDIELTFNNTGDAVVVNKVKFHVANGPMTAMIIENMALNPTKFGKLQYDLDGKEEFSKVILTKVGSKKYDLEAVPKIPNGDAYLRFSYYGNMLKDGFIGKTMSNYGELVYFDWAPMQWASALKYRKVAINLPHQVDKSECDKEFLFKKYLGYLPTDGMNDNSTDGVIKTEKALNQRNKIDIGCVDAGNDRYLLQLVIVQENVRAREAQRIQFYMPADFIAFSESAQVRTIKQSPVINISKYESQFVIHPDGVSDLSHTVTFDVTNGPIASEQLNNIDLTESYDDIHPENVQLIQTESHKAIKVSASCTSGSGHMVIKRPAIEDGTYRFSYDYQLNSYRSGIIGNANAFVSGVIGYEDDEDYYYFDWKDDELKWGKTVWRKFSPDLWVMKIVLPIEMPNADVSDAEFYELLGMKRGTEIKDIFFLKGKIRHISISPEPHQIDLSTTDVDGKHYLTMMSVSSGLKDKSDLKYIKTRFEIQKDLIPSLSSRHLKDEGDEDYNPDAMVVPKNSLWFLLLAAIGGGAAGVIHRKKRDKETRERVDDIEFKTVGDELWEAPELQVGGFSEAGKIAQNLHPIEVGLMLGLEIQQIVGIMVQALGDQNKLIVRSLEPIKAYPASDVSLEPIEEKFVEIFDELGDVNETKLQDFIEGVITGIQEKTWDCDLNATRNYYMNLMYKNPEEEEKDKLEFKLIEDKYFTDPTISKPDQCDEDFWHNRYYWRHYNGYYTRRYHHNLGLSQNMNMGYQQFLQSSVCFNGCFTQPNLENVCHSACHSACHDACHSACHDACHSACHSACHHACHSACHSACVSGGAR